MREEAQGNIRKTEEEKNIQCDKKSKQPRKYKVTDIVTIKRMNFGNDIKLKKIFWGYVCNYEGPGLTLTGAEYMKAWCMG